MQGQSHHHLWWLCPCVRCFISCPTLYEVCRVHKRMILLTNKYEQDITHLDCNKAPTGLLSWLETFQVGSACLQAKCIHRMASLYVAKDIVPASAAPVGLDCSLGEGCNLVWAGKTTVTCRRTFGASGPTISWFLHISKLNLTYLMVNWLHPRFLF